MTEFAIRDAEERDLPAMRDILNREIRETTATWTTVERSPRAMRKWWMDLRRDGYPINHSAIIDAAADLGVCIEINANPRRLDIDWRYCKYAKEKGVKIAISPDAHRISMIDDIKYGVGIARKGWLTKDDVLNCGSVDEVLGFAR